MFFVANQIAVYEADGSKFSRKTNKVLYISSTFLGPSGKVRTFPETMRVIPDDSVVRYTVNPDRDTKLITIRVSPQ